MLEGLHRMDLAQHPALGFHRHRVLAQAGLDLFAHPVSDPGILDVHELGADMAAVDGLQRADDLAQPHPAAAHEKLRAHFQIEILRFETEFAQAEHRVFRPCLGQRIKLGDGVTQSAVGVDQAVHACLERRIGGSRGGGHRGRVDGSCALLLAGLHRAQFKPLEKSSPGGINRGRIFLPAAVTLLEQIDVETIRERNSHKKGGGAESMRTFEPLKSKFSNSSAPTRETCPFPNPVARGQNAASEKF